MVCAGIHMSAIPSFPYDCLWGERAIRSVANLTRRDGEQLPPSPPGADAHGVTGHPLGDANRVLADLRAAAWGGPRCWRP